MNLILSLFRRIRPHAAAKASAPLPKTCAPPTRLEPRHRVHRRHVLAVARDMRRDATTLPPVKALQG